LYFFCRPYPPPASPSFAFSWFLLVLIPFFIKDLPDFPQVLIPSFVIFATAKQLQINPNFNLS